MICCNRCETTRAKTYRTSADGNTTLCQSCWELAEDENRAGEKAKREESERPERERAQKLLADLREKERSRPFEPLFCKATESHRDTRRQDGRPAVGLNERGELCCEDCLPSERNPSKLAERLAAIEQAVAALQAAKPSSKGKS